MRILSEILLYAKLITASRAVTGIPMRNRTLPPSFFDASAEVSSHERVSDTVCGDACLLWVRDFQNQSVLFSSIENSGNGDADLEVSPPI